MGGGWQEHIRSQLVRICSARRAGDEFIRGPEESIKKAQFLTNNLLLLQSLFIAGEVEEEEEGELEDRDKGVRACIDIRLII